MKKNNCILAFIIIGTAGTLWHFVYEWSGENPIIGAIAPVNESVWEHLKLLFFPSLFYFITELFLCKEDCENLIPQVQSEFLQELLRLPRSFTHIRVF